MVVVTGIPGWFLQSDRSRCVPGSATVPSSPRRKFSPGRQPYCRLERLGNEMIGLRVTQVATSGLRATSELKLHLPSNH